MTSYLKRASVLLVAVAALTAASTAFGPGRSPGGHRHADADSLDHRSPAERQLHGRPRHQPHRGHRHLHRTGRRPGDARLLQPRRHLRQHQAPVRLGGLLRRDPVREPRLQRHRHVRQLQRRQHRQQHQPPGRRLRGATHFKNLTASAGSPAALATLHSPAPRGVATNLITGTCSAGPATFDAAASPTRASPRSLRLPSSASTPSKQPLPPLPNQGPGRPGPVRLAGIAIPALDTGRAIKYRPLSFPSQGSFHEVLATEVLMRSRVSHVWTLFIGLGLTIVLGLVPLSARAQAAGQTRAERFAAAMNVPSPGCARCSPTPCSPPWTSSPRAPWRTSRRRGASIPT